MKTRFCFCVMTVSAIASLVNQGWSDEKPIPLDKLPDAVVKSVEEKYPKAKLLEATQKVDDGKIEYEVIVKVGDKKIELTMSKSGKIKSAEELRSDEDDDESEWTTDFSSEKSDLTSTGRNPFFVLEPGYQLVLEDDNEHLTFTVLNETKMVDGIETRVVEERESKNGKLIEVSRNYFAISKRTNSVYYFGEDVDMFKNGEVSSHDGSWLAGVANAKFGLLMPGLPLLDAKYQQEVAPGVAMDRSEVKSITDTVKVPAGEFKNCLKIEESSPLEPGKTDVKLYAPNIGLLKDGSLKLVRYGKVELKK